MRLSTLFVADHAEMSDGRLYVCGGGWDLLRVAELPTLLPRLCLVMGLTSTWRRGVDVEVELLDGSGGSVLPEPMTGTVEPLVMTPVDAAEETTVVTVVTLEGLPITRRGQMWWVVSVQGAEIGRLGFRVFAPVTAAAG